MPCLAMLGLQNQGGTASWPCDIDTVVFLVKLVTVLPSVDTSPGSEGASKGSTYY